MNRKSTTAELLKIMDELVVDLRSQQNITFAELEQRSSVARDAIAKLRRAWLNDEMPLMTLSLAKYFEENNECDCMDCSINGEATH